MSPYADQLPPRDGVIFIVVCFLLIVGRLVLLLFGV